MLWRHIEHVCGELKPRSGSEGAGLPGAAAERLSTVAAKAWLCVASATFCYLVLRSAAPVSRAAEHDQRLELRLQRGVRGALPYPSARVRLRARVRARVRHGAAAAALLRGSADRVESETVDPGEYAALKLRGFLDCVSVLLLTLRTALRDTSVQY